MAHSNSPKITILGAGVVGLSTALCVQELYPQLEISIVADKFNNDTLSSGAGGLFRPEQNIAPDPDTALLWCSTSYNHFKEMVNSTDSFDAGFQRVSGFQLNSHSQESLYNPLLDQLIPDYRKMRQSELEVFPPEFKYGVFFTTIITDCVRYLPWMTKKFEAKGGKVHSRTVNSLNEASNWCDILVNCTGLNAGKLAKDIKILPIRGQTIKVKAPWIKHFYYGNENYIIPSIDSVLMGGIKQFGNRNPNVDPHDRAVILNGCTRLVPSLRNVDIKEEWVGLRPFRQPVRVEMELLNCAGKQLKVVHNYGHGGHGVTLSWGTAKQAASMVEQLVKGCHKSAL